MINNRQQTGRRRGRGGQRQNNNNNSGGGSRNAESGNRIDNRTRGNAAQLLEKYKTLARDAQQAGDRVLTETYLQFADHYFRVLSETRARYEENNANRRPQGDYANEDSGFDGEEGDDGGEDEDDFGSFRQPQQRQPQPQSQPMEARQRDDRPRDDRPRDDRQDRQYVGRQRDDRPREDRPRDDRPRDDRPRRDYNEDRGNRAQQPAEVHPETDRSDTQEDTRSARRPRESANGNGRAAQADEARLDVAVLPPALSVPAPVVEVEEVAEAPAPRRRGRPRKDAGTLPLDS